MKKKCSVIFGRTLLMMMFLCGCMDIFADVVTAWNFSTIVGNMVLEGDNTERSESAVASSYYYYYKLGSTTMLRAYSNSQAWGIVLNKGEAVNVEFNITTGGSYGLNVYCVPLSGNQLRQSLPDGNVTAANIEKCVTGLNIGSTQSFAFEVKCTSEYEGTKSYKVTKNGNQMASFSVDGGQFFLVSFLNGAGTQNHDYKLSYTITVKKVTPTPSAPDMVFASQGLYSDRITVAWGYLSDGNSARSYEVYRSTTKSGSKTYLGETQELSYDDRTAAYGTTYYYWIKGKNGSKTSGYSTWEADGWLGEPDYITVSFKANGGTGSMSSQTFAQGVSQKLSANAFTRSGYEFIGWATSSGGSVVYSDQQSISLSANKTLYAVWKVIDGAFDLAFGTPSSRSWKQGFFLNNTSNGVSVMRTFLEGEKIYRNSFFCNDGSESLTDDFETLHEILNADGSVRCSYSESETSIYNPNRGYIRENKEWVAGLENLPVGTYVYRYTIDVNNDIPESNESNNIFEYSFSIIDEYTVTFNANGGTGSMSSQTFTSGVSQKLSANAFTRSGYEFIGWATSSGGSVVYSDQQSISLSANKTLYAVWKVIDGAFDLVFANVASKNWKQGFFLNNTSNGVSVMHSFLLGETIYRNFSFINRGNEILRDEFHVLHEVLNSDGTVRHSYTQFSNYEYVQNYGYYWSNNRWESGLGNLPVGSYIYRCTIDYANVIPESNESNNVFEYSFSIIDASQEDLLLEALGIEKFAVTVGGDAKWFAQKDVTHDGVSAVQSGGISDGQTSWMEVVVKDVSSVSFWWKVSSESGWDKLHFYVDGIEVVDPISGQTDWIKVEYPLTTDSHTLKWAYTKDGSVSNGDDCGWVDKVVLTPAPSTDITVDVGGGNNVNVPVEWINSYADIVAAAGGDKTAALQRTAANGRKVWECYVLGLDPTDPSDDFRITRFWMDGNMPKFEFTHTTDGSGNSFLPYVKPLGKAQLSHKWWYVPEGGNPAFRFFTVEVVPPGCESSIVDEEDLGGVKLWEGGPYWAECNVGATKPEEYGYYFWWGDTVGYTNTGSGWISVKDGTSISFSYSGIAASTDCKDNAALLSAGYIDSTGNLARSHDAATAHLGSPWRMPTRAEFNALISNCTTTWMTKNGVYGRLFTGKGAYADKSIFLPAAGFGRDSYLNLAGSRGYYWSSTPDSGNSCSAWLLYVNSGYFYESSGCRCYGHSVRPVRDCAK